MVSLPFALLNNILYFNEEWNPYLLLAVFIIIWVNDTFAYLVGSTLGKHRLFERISPKKSWEGFVGGAVAALGAGYVLSLFIIDLAWWQWLIFSLLVVVFGTFGDLMESFIKRSVKVKDSGRLIPGHGGLLDRFDSMLLVVPIIYFYLLLI
jgi:phosphatidate cytidylyltransferase